jgi:hypothetical protein
MASNEKRDESDDCLMNWKECHVCGKKAGRVRGLVVLDTMFETKNISRSLIKSLVI